MLGSSREDSVMSGAIRYRRKPRGSTQLETSAARSPLHWAKSRVKSARAAPLAKDPRRPRVGADIARLHCATGSDVLVFVLSACAGSPEPPLMLAVAARNLHCPQT